MKKKVSDYFVGCAIKTDHIISGIFEDSRKVIPNGVFIVIKGYKTNGIEYINDAINNGAKSIITEEKIDIKSDVNVIIVLDTRVELARMLKWYYNSYNKPYIIGITGTNGKTSVSNYVFNVLSKLNKNVLLIGTEGQYSYYNGKLENYGTNNTTPSITILYQLIYGSDKRYEYVVMEVSSQGICEKRVLGLDYDLICYTNITQDHLDYHHSMNEYFHAKAELALRLNENNVIVLNKNMNYYNLLKKASIAKCVTFSDILNSNANYCGEVIFRNIDSMNLRIMIKNQSYILKTKLIGDFNLENILATLAIISELPLKQKINLKVLENIKPVIGRMNVYQLKGYYVVIDFAHTPDGIEQVLSYFNFTNVNRIITVVGCGGNRDQTKRAIMGKIATEKSDFVIFTEDNSRNEKFQNIINDITTECSNNYKIIESRPEAILEATKMSKNNDIVIILGKGNEQYIKKDKVIKFSDIEFIESLGGIRLNG